MHCFVATLDEQELSNKRNNPNPFPFISFPSKDKPKTKNKKEEKHMETSVKKVFIENAEDFENCYFFSPSIGLKNNKKVYVSIRFIHFLFFKTNFPHIHKIVLQS